MKFKINIAILFLFIFFISTTFSQNQVIDKLRITWDQDPSTTATIIWNAIEKNGANHIVHYDTIDYGTSISNYSFQANTDKTIYYKGMQNSVTRLKNLTPNTAYYFVISTPKGISNRYWFKTISSNPNDRLSFISGGDSRTNRKVRQKGNLLVKKLRPHAVFFDGDMTSTGTTSQWKKWFDDWQITIGDDGRIIPILVARGNHETSNKMMDVLFQTGPDVYYALNFGGSLLKAYTLNTEIEIPGAQTEWFENNLKKSKHFIWKFVQYHQPIRPHVKKKSEGHKQYKHWANLFYYYNVNLVSEAHSHTSKTTYPISISLDRLSEHGFIRDDLKGTVYIGEGTWGAPLRTADDNKSWTRASGKINQFKWFFVDKNRIEIRTVKIDNAFDVHQIEDKDIFTPPTNLDIWSPPNGSGDVITIIKRP